MSKSNSYLVISIVIVVILIGGIYLLINSEDNQEENLVNNPTNKVGEEDTNIYNNKGIQFRYPQDFNITEEIENLPEDNNLEIYVSPIIEVSVTDNPQLSISVYNNINNLSVPDFIDEMKNKSVILLLGDTSESISDSYDITTITISDKKFEQYKDKITNERIIFNLSDEKIIIISEIGVSDNVMFAYDLMLETLQYLN